MKLKYYLRGLGIGVLVTTIILAIALNRKPMELTDAQIKERAAQLGMVEKGNQEDKKTNEKSEKTTEKIPASSTVATTAVPETTQKTTEAVTTQGTTVPPATTQKTIVPVETQEQHPAAKPQDGTMITIEIGTYDWSNHVAEKLAAAGLVESAAEFDQYLIDHGYETKIRSGNHTFRMGASHEELAQELVSRPD